MKKLEYSRSIPFPYVHAALTDLDASENKTNTQNLKVDWEFPTSSNLDKCIRDWGELRNTHTLNTADYCKPVTLVKYSKTQLKKLNKRQLKKIMNRRIKNNDNIQQYKMFPVNMPDTYPETGMVDVEVRFEMFNHT